MKCIPAIAVYFCLSIGPGPVAHAQEQPKSERSPVEAAPRVLELVDRLGTTGTRNHQHEAAVGAIAVARHGNIIASSWSESEARIWDIASRKMIRSLESPGGGVRAVTFSPDSRWLAVAGDGGWIGMFDVQNMNKIWENKIINHDAIPELPSFENLDMFNTLSISPSGSLLAAGGDGPNQEIALIDAQTGREIRRLVGHKGPVYSVAFAPDGKSLASGGFDGTIRLWDPDTGREIRRLVGHERNVYSVAFAPDGKSLASGGGDGTIRLWDPASGRETRRLVGHKDPVWVYSIAFAPDGKSLASGGADATVRIWDLASGQELRRSICRNALRVGIWALEYSLDGTRVFAGDGDTILILNVD